MNLKNIILTYWYFVPIAIVGSFILAFVFGRTRMNDRILEEIDMIMSTEKVHSEDEASLIKKEDLDDLPQVVSNWLEQTGIIGQSRILSVSLSQSGYMKLDKDQEEWAKARAKQYIRIDQPAYLWHADIPMIPIIGVKGHDLFYEGKGSMEIKAGSFINLVEESDSYKLNESSLHRFLLELPWYPTAALEDYIRWEEIDKKSARAIISYKDLEAEAIFYFNEEKELIRQEALRYKENDTKAQRIPCIGEITSYTRVDGLKIPDGANISWIIGGEKFTWYKLKNSDIEIKRK